MNRITAGLDLEWAMTCGSGLMELNQAARTGQRTLGHKTRDETRELLQFVCGCGPELVERVSSN